MEMSDVTSSATKWFDDEEASVVVEALLPHKALVRDMEKATERFFTAEEYIKRSENNEGICLACLEEVYGVEPDARNYTCEACGRNEVFGLEELMIMGKIAIL